MKEFTRYTLMHQNTAVLNFSLHHATGVIGAIETITAEHHAPVGTLAQGHVGHGLLNSWWTRRRIPDNRDGIKAALDVLNLRGTNILIEKCFGISLSDQYWVRPEGTYLTWADINFFHNDFSDDMGHILFGAKLDSANTDLMSPDNTSDGWLKKKWKIIDGTRCLVKAGSGTVHQEPYNEVVATLLCETMGIPHIPYRLTMVEDTPCCICDNFIEEHTELVSAWAVMQTAKKPNHLSVHQHYLACCQGLGVQDAQQMVNQMIVLDYLMMNEDRHQGNFGLIRNAETLEWVGSAPIFDTGSALGFRFITPRIKGNAVIPCKPFKTSHQEQIKLVSDFSFVNIQKLRSLREPFLAIFQGSEFVDQARAEAIYDAYLNRVDSLETYMADRHLAQFETTLQHEVELNTAYSGEPVE